MTEVYREIGINRLECLLRDHHKAIQDSAKDSGIPHIYKDRSRDLRKQIEKEISRLVGADLQHFEAVLRAVKDRIEILKAKAEELCSTRTGTDPFDNMDELNDIVGRHEQLIKVKELINPGDVGRWVDRMNSEGSLTFGEGMRKLELVVFNKEEDAWANINAPYPGVDVPDPAYLGGWLTRTLGRGWRVNFINAVHVRPGKRGHFFRVVSERRKGLPYCVTYWQVSGKAEQTRSALDDFVKKKCGEYEQYRRREETLTMEKRNEADQKKLEEMSRFTDTKVTRNEAGGYDFD